MRSIARWNERRRIPAALAALALTADGGMAAALANEPPAPATPAQILAYHDSGEWDRDLSAVVARARHYLAAHAGRRRTAIVLDIDDTSLSTYDCLKRVDFDRGAADCGASRHLPAIRQTRALYRDARARDVTVVFITGRKERLRRSSVSNLHARGFDGRLHLVMRPDGRRRKSNATYKLRERRRLAAEGYHVILNVGDQRSDLHGGGAARGVKLPNPMYVTP